MDEKRLDELAQEVHEIGCPLDDDEHTRCSPKAREHYPIELAIAKWHLSKIEALEEKLRIAKEALVFFAECGHRAAREALEKLEI